MQNQDIFKSRCAPSIERYSGVVYENIDWLNMTDSEKNYILSQFNLLKSVGLLNSTYLKIK